MTITEGLAEIKTNAKKILKKRESIALYLTREANLVDPLVTEQNGSAGYIQRQLQAIFDLEGRNIAIRRAIARANSTNQLTLSNITQSISDWLVWRKEIAPFRQNYLNHIRQRIETSRQQAQRRGATVVGAGNAVVAEAGQPVNVIVNVNEVDIAHQIEELDTILGNLDGQLSLRNATTNIEIQ